MFEVLLERSAAKDLRRLPPRIQDQVIDRIAALAKNPRPSGSRKLSGAKHDWRIRVGDYRALYDIADKLRTVRVYRIRHRREVYR